MQHVLLLGMLMFLAAPLAAQEVERPVPADLEVRSEVIDARSLDGADALTDAHVGLLPGARADARGESRVDVQSGSDEEKAGPAALTSADLGLDLDRLELADVEIDRSGTDGEDTELRRQVDSRSWWWMVAGIVTAGVILAVLL